MGEGSPREQGPISAAVAGTHPTDVVDREVGSLLPRVGDQVDRIGWHELTHHLVVGGHRILHACEKRRELVE
jgi:hypothetical protein